MRSVPAPNVIRRMRFVYIFLMVVVSSLFLVTFYLIVTSEVPLEEWESSIQMALSNLTLLAALSTLLFTHGYSAKLVDQSEAQLGVANEQVKLMRRQLGVAAQQLEATKRQLDNVGPANSNQTVEAQED